MSNQSEQNIGYAPSGAPAPVATPAAPQDAVNYGNAGAYQAPVQYEDDVQDTYRRTRRGKDKKPDDGKGKNGEEPMKRILRIVISILIIALGIFIILWAVAKASLFGSIGEMLRRMGTDLQVMFARITS